MAQLENVITDHDSENHTLLVRWGDDYSESIDFGPYVLDYDTKGNVIGVELLDFKLETKQ